MIYSPRDMKLMAIGEIGVFILAGVVAVVGFATLENTAMLLRILAAMVAWHLVSKYGLQFIHWGYHPEKRS